MSVGGWLVLLALLPAALWLAAGLGTLTRRALRRRGDERTRTRRLARMLGARDLVVVPTGDVDLDEATVRAVAAERGYRLLGYERGRDPFRRRSGVFVRVGGGVDRAIGGTDGSGDPVGPGVTGASTWAPASPRRLGRPR